MAIQIQLRNDTAANWTANDPILAVGEMGLETDTKAFKIGDGVLSWSALAYGGVQGTAGLDGQDGADGADGAGIPIGGTAGQMLSKIDGTDYNAEWVDNAGGAASEQVLVNVYNSTASIILAGTPIKYSPNAGNGSVYVVAPWPTDGSANGAWTDELLGLAATDIPADFGAGQVLITGTISVPDTLITWTDYVYLNAGTGTLQSTPAGNTTWNTPIGIATSGNGNAIITLLPWNVKQKLTDAPDLSINYGSVVDGDVLSFNSSNFQFEFRTPTGGATVNDNLLLNGGFDVWQEINESIAATFTKSTTPGSQYFADNWKSTQFGGTGTMAQTRLSLGSGEWTTKYGLQTTATADGGGFQFSTYIEDVRTIEDAIYTLSYWVKRSGGGYTVPIIDQNFGSGGSGTVNTFANGQVVAADTWTYVTDTFTMPSVANKVFGTNSHIAININFQGLGSSEVLSIAEVKLELGSSASKFKHKYDNKSVELKACQRYYYRINGEAGTTPILGTGFVEATSPFKFRFQVDLPAAMMSTPTFSTNSLYPYIHLGSGQLSGGTGTDYIELWTPYSNNKEVSLQYNRSNAFSTSETMGQARLATTANYYDFASRF